jgi:Tol biopolymer transport system component
VRFQPGVRFGPYELVAFLGAGGMGEVYRAVDTRLDRSVVIKVLSGDLENNPESRQRFEREARVISALSHPHICSLFDIGHHEGVDFLVMEYLEGETLAQRVLRGPLPIDLVLKYAIQIADALDQAHRQGVIHRDLKPGNIVITPTGAKLLDFGLAKLQPAVGFGNETTETVAVNDLTNTGTIVGTLTYMAPEQLETGVVSPRSDIFSFGAVMYEMATGKRAFQGRSQASAIAAVLSGTPTPIAVLQPSVPPPLDRVITTCLAKDPDERWQTARDLLRELRWIAQESATRPSAGAMPSVVPAPRMTPLKAALLTGGILSLLAFAVIAVVWYQAQPPRDTLLRFTVTSLPGMTVGRRTVGAANVEANAPAISPDGRLLAFVATSEDGTSNLFMRRLDAIEPALVPHTVGASRPFWSPDSRFLAFFADGKLKKIDTRGGRPFNIADATNGFGGTWNARGVIVFGASSRGGLFRVPDTGGVPVALTTVSRERQENGHLFPSFLPDGEHFLYLATGDDPNTRGIYVGSLSGNPPVHVLSGRFKAAYAEPGHMLYVRDNTLFAHAFDPRKRQLIGTPPVPLADSVAAGAFSVSSTGVLAFQPLNESRSRLIWFDRQGNELGRIAHLIENHPIALSPDGRQVAVIRNDPQTESRRQDIWAIDLSRDVVTRFAANEADDCCPAWSADGREIVFSSDRSGLHQVFRGSLGGGTPERLVFKTDASVSVKDLSDDGTVLLVSISDDLFLLPLNAEPQLRPLVRSRAAESDGKFSPDGRYVAYVSNDSGRMEVYLTAVASPDQRWQLSAAGGYQPRWRADGKEMYYVNADSRLMAVSVTTAPRVDIGRPHELFRTPLAFPGDNPFMTRYDVAPDGRFLLNVPLQQGEPPINVVVNWLTALSISQ